MKVSKMVLLFLVVLGSLDVCAQSVDKNGKVLPAITSAVQTALNLKEDAANKSTDVTLADATNVKFPTELAVKTYVDAAINTSNAINANLTGVVTSTGNATSIANGAITNTMLANGAVANLTGTNTGDQTNITGNAATATNVTGIVAVANGGTGSSTQNFVDLTTAQTVAGAKTFSVDAKVNNLNVGKGSGNKTSNTVFGYNALGTTNTADYNTGLGYESLAANTTGSQNTGLGYQSLFTNSVGVSNNAFGYRALFRTTGSYNVAIGNSSLYENNDKSYNVAVGFEAMRNTRADGNTSLGYKAGITNTTGTNNTIIGSNADLSNQWFSNATAIGNGAIVTLPNTIQLGNTSVTDVKTSGTLTAGTVTYPKAHNTIAGQVLTTNASGVASWSTQNFVDLSTTQTVAGAKTLSGITTISNATASTSTSSGALIVNGGAGITGAVYAGSIQNTPVGSTTASTGSFTTLAASGATTLGGTLAVTGATTLTGAANLNGGLTMDTDKFTVADGTGNTTIDGTLGIGTTTPDPSAKLDVSATNKGFLPPRVTLTSTSDNTTIPNPATALLVWNTGASWGGAAYYYNSGTSGAPVWAKIINNSADVEWTNYSPTFEGSTTAPTKATTHQEGYMYKVVGKTLYLKGYYYHYWATGAAAGSGDLLIPLPSGYTINTSVCPAIGTANEGITLGYCHVEHDGNIGTGAVKVYDATRIKFVCSEDINGMLKRSVSSVWYTLTANNYDLTFSCEIPIN